MTLKDRLTDDMKQAMKERNNLKLSVIRMLKAAIKNEEIVKMKELNDEELLGIIQREIKKRQEAIAEYEKGHRSDLVAKEEAEMMILYSYLPAQASDEEIREVIKKIVEEIPEGEKIVIGKIMPKALAELKGKADGKRINKIAQEFI